MKRCAAASALPYDAQRVLIAAASGSRSPSRPPPPTAAARRPTACSGGGVLLVATLQLAVGMSLLGVYEGFKVGTQ